MNESDQNRTTESSIQYEILRLLSDGRERTNAQLKRALSKELPLTKSDRARANERPNEEKWEELVNNALSPSRSSSLPAKGFTESLRRGVHRITRMGKEQADFYEELESELKNAGAFD